MHHSLLVIVMFLLIGHPFRLAIGESQPAEDPKLTSPFTKIKNDDLGAAKEAIQKQLRKLDPDIPIESIDITPINGLYSVNIKGGRTLYASPDGRHLIRGDMLEIDDGKIINLTSKSRNKNIAEQLSKVPVNDMIVFSPKGETKGVVYAFTDIECGYCRKLHQEIAEMNALGIELRYLAYPRGGKQAPSYSKMVSVWCAEDRKMAISNLSNSVNIPEKTCPNNPVDTQLELGAKLGVSGTPALFLEDGRSIPGYRPAKDLAKIMKISPPLTDMNNKPPKTPDQERNIPIPKHIPENKVQVAPAA